MLAQTDIQREIYEARHKGQLDYLTDLRVERRLGQDEGIAQGMVFAEIQMLQRFLRLPVTDGGTLEAKSADEVSRLRDELATAARGAGIELS